MKFDTLKEAYREALLKAEGYHPDMRIPIFKNDDGTYETGGAQYFQLSDVSDGTFEEIGSVRGWFFDDEDNGLSKQEQLDHFISDPAWLEEQFQLFVEQFSGSL